MDIILSTAYLVSGFIILYILTNLLLPDTELRQGVYAVPGGRWYALKWLLIYCALKLKHKKKKRTGGEKSQSVGENVCDVTGKGYGISSHGGEEDMEFVTDVGNDPNGNNSVYIYGINTEDGTLIDVRIAKRQNGVREVWFLLRLHEIGDLVLPQHPRTLIHDVQSNTFEAAGLKIELVEPLKTWNITYQGDCRIGTREMWSKDDGRKSVHVSCSLQWTARTPHVNFDTDINPRLMAENIAKEKWSGALFENMKRLHQTHYEQFGEIKGIVNVSGHPQRTLCASGVRDRSFGPRNWQDFHSYCLLFAVFECKTNASGTYVGLALSIFAPYQRKTNDGTSLHVGAFCIPKIFSHLYSGYMIDKTGLKVPMISSTLSLPDIIRDKEPSRDFSFTIKMENGMTYTISVHTESTMVLFPDDTYNIKILESKAEFKINGLPGYGISEWLTK